MEKLNTSKYKLYTIGTVASDLIEGYAPIEVYPHEILPNYTGDINKIDDVNMNVLNSEGKSFNVALEHKRVLTAVWLGDGTNRVTPPNVRKGEKVLIYRYADVDLYYWTVKGLELDLRRLEHVTHMYVNTGDENVKVVDEKNSYYTTMSTLNKYFKIHLSDNDGEVTTYDIVADAKSGYLQLRDGKQNSITIDSIADKVSITANREISLKADTIGLYAKNIIISAVSTEVAGSFACSTLKCSSIVCNTINTNSAVTPPSPVRPPNEPNRRI